MIALLNVITLPAMLVIVVPAGMPATANVPALFSARTKSPTDRLLPEAVIEFSVSCVSPAVAAAASCKLSANNAQSC